MTEPTARRARLAAAIDNIRVVDTHEHISDEEVALDHEASFFDFFEHYVSSDLVSAGMPFHDLEAMRDRANGFALEDRWALMAPYWPYVRFTGYGQAMREYMRDLFDVDEIDATSYLDLCARIRDAHRPGWYRTVLKDKARIATALLTRWPGQHVNVDRDFFRAVPILDHFATPVTRADLRALEVESGVAIESVDQLVAALETRLDTFIEAGIVGVKVFLAYQRSLLFEKVNGITAERCFNRVLLRAAEYATFEDLKPLQDYIMRRLIGLAADRGLPIQIHTGLQEGNGNYLEHANPLLLTNLFLEFPNARFDVFHAGYPYTSQVAALAKNFPNVYADLCWIPAVSPRVATRTLHEWIETVPANKILFAGGDSNYVEGAYGHWKVARRIATDVLAEKVERGEISEDEALWLARRILRDNAADLFRLTDLGD